MPAWASILATHPDWFRTGLVKVLVQEASVGSPDLDRQGDYVIAWWIALALSVVCAVTVYLASPGKVRMVAGKVTR